VPIPHPRFLIVLVFLSSLLLTRIVFLSASVDSFRLISSLSDPPLAYLFFSVPHVIGTPVLPFSNPRKLNQKLGLASRADPLWANKVGTMGSIFPHVFFFFFGPNLLFFFFFFFFLFFFSFFFFFFPNALFAAVKPGGLMGNQTFSSHLHVFPPLPCNLSVSSTLAVCWKECSSVPLLSSYFSV